MTNDALADQGAADGASGLADGDDDIQGVVVNEPLDLACAFGLNYPEFPNSCSWRQLAFDKHVLDVLVDGPDVFLEQIGQLALAEPEGFLVESDVDA